MSLDYETLIAQTRHNAAIEAEEYNLVALLKPRVFIDGNAWCVMFGENVQDSVCGFGDTAYQAVIDFNKAWNVSLAGRDRNFCDGKVPKPYPWPAPPVRNPA